MIVQTLTNPTPAHVLIASHATQPAFTAIVAPEASELAQRLRSAGWIARAGWLSRARGGRVWLVRFESPGELLACV